MMASKRAHSSGAAKQTAKLARTENAAYDAGMQVHHHLFFALFCQSAPMTF